MKHIPAELDEDLILYDGGGKSITKFHMHEGIPYVYNPRMEYPGKKLVLTRTLTLKTTDGRYIRNYKDELATDEFLEWYDGVRNINRKHAENKRVNTNGITQKSDASNGHASQSTTTKKIKMKTVKPKTQKRQTVRMAQNMQQPQQTRRTQKSQKRKNNQITQKYYRPKEPIELNKYVTHSSNRASSSTSIQRKQRSTKNKNLEVFNLSRNYESLGLREGDFYNDVCLVLKKMKQKANILFWDEESVLGFENVLPYIREKTKSWEQSIFKGDILQYYMRSNNPLYLGNDALKINKVIGEGSNGKIYSASLGNRDAVVKMSKNGVSGRNERLEYYSELIIQNELFCSTRGSLGPSMAKIPKPLFLCKYKNKRSMDAPLLGMESLSTSTTNFLDLLHRNHKSKVPQFTKEFCTKQVIHMLYCVANTLEYLQNEFEFIHRDLHGGNIMAKYENSQLPQWHIIDFGMSTMMLNGERINESNKCCNGMYEHGISDEHFNRCHDLRQFFFSLMYYSDNTMSSILEPEVYDVFYGLFHSLKRQIQTLNLEPSFSNLCHKLYGDAIVRMNSPMFEPAAFKCILEKMSITKKYLKYLK